MQLVGNILDFDFPLVCLFFCVFQKSVAPAVDLRWVYAVLAGHAATHPFSLGIRRPCFVVF